MADNIAFPEGYFATYGMLPTSDDEVTALWGRKAAHAAAKVFGQWATIVMGTTTNTDKGSCVVYFDSLGYQDFPTIDLYHVRGGTELVAAPSLFAESFADTQPAGFAVEYFDSLWRKSGRSYIIINFWTDYDRDSAGASPPFNTNHPEFATIMIRLRGN